MSGGPLAGLRIVEIAGIGPAPYGCMMLADLGADVILVERPAAADHLHAAAHSVLFRNRRRTEVDLKTPEGVATVLDLVADADVLVEGFRPGVTERLGIGPEPCLRRNPRLVYARMTGWGQHGPLAHTAGHDLNYIARSGALAAFGPPDRPPVAPLNLLGDFGAGGMLLALGVLAAVHETRASGRGQVVDAAIIDGTVSMLGMLSGLRAAGQWHERGRNQLDGSAANYTVYECADGRHLAVGALEPQFFQQFLRGLGLDPDDLPARAEQHTLFARIIRGRTRDDWDDVFKNSDACVSSVLTADEAVADPHNTARQTWLEIDGVLQPAPAPRFSRTPADPPRSSPAAGHHRVAWSAGESG